MYEYAEIIIEQDSNALDRLFTYLIPEEFLHLVTPGMRVKVPFGRGNKTVYGFVIRIISGEMLEGDFKSIIALWDKKPVLRQEDLMLIEYMRIHYLCSYVEAIKVILPSAYLKGKKDIIQELIYCGKPLDGKYLTPAYEAIYKLVSGKPGVYNRNQLSKVHGLSNSSINTLLKHGYLTLISEKVSRLNSSDSEAYPKKQLNIYQRKIREEILSAQGVYLLEGITGSGKTEIYLNLAEEMLNRGKESIILVPEIALTPQMLERFRGRFKDIAVFHSRLSQTERLEEWKRVKAGKVKIALGARSAIFLPFNNLGLIVIDEEHENSYKSDSDPKYHARDIAVVRSKFHGGTLLLGSATPSLESYYRTKLKEFIHLKLDKRVDGALRPAIEVVDMREELKQGNKSVLSTKLYSALQQVLEKNEQCILFLNRRGYSTFVSCRKCGFVLKCPNCDVTMTYHVESKKMECHYCGKKKPMVDKCPACGSLYIKHFGLGTEKLEQEIVKLFPRAKVLRMDADTTRTKNSHELIYKNFKNKEANILIGTQMIAKGLDFEEVTLVGVIAADLSLNLPDYRASEKTFQLLTQVGGRAGRGSKEGHVIVQTYNPENFSIRCAASYNLDELYTEELAIRKQLNYPPFGTIISLLFTSEKEDILIKYTHNLSNILKYEYQENDKISILGPCPSLISRIKNQYRWQILIKGTISLEEAAGIKQRVYESIKDVYNEIRVNLDINPNSFV